MHFAKNSSSHPIKQEENQANTTIYAFLSFTPKTLLEEQSILSKQVSIFLENHLSEQAELSKQGGIFQERS